MNIHNPSQAGGNGASRPPEAAAPARRRAARSTRRRSTRSQALLGDRPRRRDLLIEHLHLIQDNYGHLSAAHLAALAAEMKLALTEVYEVATFYAHFDVVKEGETPPPPVTVRVCDSLSCAMAGAEQLLDDLPGKLGAGRARRARALHGRLRPCAGRARSAMCRSMQRRRGKSVTRGASSAHAHAAHARQSISTPIRRRAAIAAARSCLDGKRTRDDLIKIVERRRPARPRRRGLPDRPQMDAGARRAGAAPDGGQWRRRRARHLQGPLLSRPRSAPLHRRHADRRLGGRGDRHLHLPPRRISRAAADAARRDRARSSRPGSRRTPASICAAAPAPTSAAKNPR